MNLASARFLLFFAALLALYYTVPRRFQWKLLLAGNLFFYWFAGWQSFAYISATTLTTFLTARRIHSLSMQQDAWLSQNRASLSKEARKAWKAKAKTVRMRWLAACLVFNFGILAVVKYTGFAAQNVNSLAAVFGSGALLPAVSFVLPMGISFYTFMAMGYLLDVYWGKCAAEQNLGRFALFVTFFPQLVQGPISRFGALQKTLYAEHRWDSRLAALGAQRILWGLAKKRIVADRLAIPLAALTADPAQYSGVYVLAVMFLYAVQLYADFTGGIDVALGAAQMLGIELAENFQRPFFSKNTAEYWRRWHITMGTWFRDYLFYPLSVSRPILKLHQKCRGRFGTFGKRISVHVCTLSVWLVTGLWHGANWNFVVWGLLNGIVIVVSEELKPLYTRFHARFPRLAGTRAWDAVQIARTFWLMSAIRVLDVYRDVPLTFHLAGTVFTSFHPSVLWNGSFLALGLGAGDWAVAALGAGAMLLCSLLGRKEPVREQIVRRGPDWVWGVCALLALLILVFGVYGVGYDASQFIYNQF